MENTNKDFNTVKDSNCVKGKAFFHKKSIMIQGTASSVGKSTVVAGLCRVFCQDGYEVAPFKSQNMALNSFITSEGREMGRAQVVQAEAAEKEPTVEMNPILLKPTTDRKSQVIINGSVYGNMSAMEYHNFKPQLADMIREIYTKLSDKNDIVVIEGAGSPAEINLREKDIVNMGMAEISDSPVILVGDIDKGGVFASIAGTMLLLTDKEKARVKGVIINKFRGDVEILKPGLKMLEDIIKVPVLGVLPYTKINLEDEDSLAERFTATVRKEKGEAEGEIQVAVVKIPHISNFTDFNALENITGVDLKYVTDPRDLENPDMVILPGSKNTIEDMVFLKESGFENKIKALNEKGAVVFGICGGYQMLGNRIEDPHKTESSLLAIDGMGLLNTKTIFQEKKVTTQVEGELTQCGEIFPDGGDKFVKGYEIHMGTTEYFEGCIPFIKIKKELGQAKESIGGIRNEAGTVLGTYIHGIFDNPGFTASLINKIRSRKGLKEMDHFHVPDFKAFKEQEYNRLAHLIRSNLDMKRIYEIAGLPVKGE